MPRVRVQYSRGDKGNRTPNLFHAMEARYQLRHIPVNAFYLDGAQSLAHRVRYDCAGFFAVYRLWNRARVMFDQ